MMNKLLSLTILLLISRLASAEPANLAVPGKLLFEDDFARTNLAPKWRAGKGFFTISEGVVTASENPGDHHGAYAYINPAIAFKDVVVEYSFRLDGSRACHLMVNDTTYKESHAGHILRATVFPGKVSLADYKFGDMKNEIFDKMRDTNTSAADKQKLRESIKDKQAAFTNEADFKDWHVARVEILGDEMLVKIDGKAAGYLRSAGLDHATKNSLGFEVAGKSTQIKQMKVWEATPSPDWEKRRGDLIGALPK